MRRHLIGFLFPLFLACPGPLAAQTSAGMDCALISGTPMVV